MCSTHKTDFKTSNFYNKIPSRIQIRVAWCLSIYIKVVTFNVHITYNIYISCVYKTNLFMCIMIYFCWNMGIIKVAYTAVIHESISIIIKINFRYNNIYFYILYKYNIIGNNILNYYILIPFCTLNIKNFHDKTRLLNFGNCLVLGSWDCPVKGY